MYKEGSLKIVCGPKAQVLHVLKKKIKGTTCFDTGTLSHDVS